MHQKQFWRQPLGDDGFWRDFAMKNGFLSQYFDGAAAKILSQVEANILASHQHEFNGVGGLRQILGEPSGKVKYPAKCMYFTDCYDEPIIEDGELTWYDARQKAREERDVQRTEYRLYFLANTVMQSANVGDILIIAKQRDNAELLLIIAEKETTIASQLLWLFGFSTLEHPGFSIREELETEQDRIAFASRIILENIGIEVEITEENYLDDMLRKFKGEFPSTKDFSEYARATLHDIDFEKDCDNILMCCYEREEILYRTLEKHIVGEKLKTGFYNVDDFFDYSKSAQNRRKSRAGLALENHIEFLFQKNNVRYNRAPVTENNSKPDFLFPGIEEYKDQRFDGTNLTMLGVKSTCKDRWRQILLEANRIEAKHVLTLESAISINQTDEMQRHFVQLVVPQKIRGTFKPEQQRWLLTFTDFLRLVKERQKYKS
jgi:hypothetical protein